MFAHTRTARPWREQALSSRQEKSQKGGSLEPVVIVAQTLVKDQQVQKVQEEPTIVAPRWPPRCTAALDAFLAVRRTGKAMDYDGEVKEYAFGG